MKQFPGIFSRHPQVKHSFHIISLSFLLLSFITRKHSWITERMPEIDSKTLITSVIHKRFHRLSSVLEDALELSNEAEKKLIADLTSSFSFKLFALLEKGERRRMRNVKSLGIWSWGTYHEAINFDSRVRQFGFFLLHLFETCSQTVSVERRRLDYER